jgi:hypothetical protein
MVAWFVVTSINAEAPEMTDESLISGDRWPGEGWA